MISQNNTLNVYFGFFYITTVKWLKTYISTDLNLTQSTCMYVCQKTGKEKQDNVFK